MPKAQAKTLFIVDKKSPQIGEISHLRSYVSLFFLTLLPLLFFEGPIKLENTRRGKYQKIQIGILKLGFQTLEWGMGFTSA